MQNLKVNLKINNQPVTVTEGTTILEAAQMLNFRIPTLCNHSDLIVAGNCRVCVVEVKGSRLLVASCATPVSEGMEVFTNSKKVRAARKHIIELLLSEHNADCTKCFKNQHCELQNLASEYRIGEHVFLDLIEEKSQFLDLSSPAIAKDISKCVRCQRCVRTCKEMQSVSALAVVNRGHKQKISTFFDHQFHEIICTNCGQCINHCPTGALTERNNIEEVWDAIYDPAKFVVVQTAPSVRVGLGEDFDIPAGTRLTGKMVSALKKLGFNKVLDTNFAAYLTVMEEGYEFLGKLKKVFNSKSNGVKLPHMTSCSPAWIKFQEHIFPDLLNHLSTCKSPQQMFGTMAKTYYAEKIDVDPKDMVVVSVMPCTAKKFECERPEMRSSGYKDVDYVLTTRELSMMIKQAGIDLKSLNDMKHDSILGTSSGAGMIFGSTGGVMEAVLRTIYEIITGDEIPFKDLNVKTVRGMDGLRDTSIRFENTKPEWEFLKGQELKLAVASGLSNARKLMEHVQEGKKEYHFIEIMACPGGCLGGGGQPIPVDAGIRQKRAKAIYEEDMKLDFRKSHENPEIKTLYEEFLGKPLSELSEKYLHTYYKARKRI